MTFKGFAFQIVDEGAPLRRAPPLQLKQVSKNLAIAGAVEPARDWCQGFFPLKNILYQNGRSLSR